MTRWRRPGFSLDAFATRWHTLPAGAGITLPCPLHSLGGGGVKT